MTGTGTRVVLGERLAAEEYVGCGAVIEIAVRCLGDRWHLALQCPAVVIMQVVNVEPLLSERRRQRSLDRRAYG